MRGHCVGEPTVGAARQHTHGMGHPLAPHPGTRSVRASANPSSQDELAPVEEPHRATLAAGAGSGVRRLRVRPCGLDEPGGDLQLGRVALPGARLEHEPLLALATALPGDADVRRCGARADLERAVGEEPSVAQLDLDAPVQEAAPVRRVRGHQERQEHALLGVGEGTHVVPGSPGKPKRFQ